MKQSDDFVNAGVDFDVTIATDYELWPSQAVRTAKWTSWRNRIDLWVKDGFGDFFSISVEDLSLGRTQLAVRSYGHKSGWSLTGESAERALIELDRFLEEIA